jgi:hypothetical protein
VTPAPTPPNDPPCDIAFNGSCLDACGSYDSNNIFQQAQDDCGNVAELQCVTFEYLGFNYNDLASLHSFLPVGPNGQQKQPDGELTITSPGPAGVIAVAVDVVNGDNGTVESSCSAVAVGHTFELCGTWGDSTEIVLTGGPPQQSWTVGFHTSCSLSLEVGDTYGSIRVVSMTNTLGCSSDTFTTTTTTTLPPPSTEAQQKLQIFFPGAIINTTNENAWIEAVEQVLFDSRRARRALVDDPTDVIDIATDSNSVTLTLRNAGVKAAIENQISTPGFCPTVEGETYCGTQDDPNVSSGLEDGPDSASSNSNTASLRTTAAIVAGVLVVLVAAAVFGAWRQHRAKVEETKKIAKQSPFDWDDEGLSGASSVTTPPKNERSVWLWDWGGRSPTNDADPEIEVLPNESNLDDRYHAAR